MALAFGMLGIAAGLILTPALNRGALQIAFNPEAELSGQIDRTVTGSVVQASATSGAPTARSTLAQSTEFNLPNGTSRYIIRRSVIQKDPAEPCYIFEDGTSKGGC
ncbi:MAG: hypothetical protein GKR97_17380 [Rhizobiaceae bacterium]|nr:hypothetical protein [Rhizobiaceae bacterium]